MSADVTTTTRAQEPSDETLREVALTRDEYREACRRVGRDLNAVELGIVGGMWSEHCGYQHSRPLLKRFPTDGERVLVGAGEENAGAVDIGDGYAIVMKVESHNHPSAVEPFQGAATGVGGILRDIFTLGARPVAILDALRFGPSTDKISRATFHGVVDGIAQYGNALGVPNLGGDTFFDATYDDNCLVNVVAIGLVLALIAVGAIVASLQIARAIHRHPGKVTVYVPHYAMSGGTLVAMAADEIVMSADAVLGPVDPQVGQYPAASVVRAVDAKPVADVDDTTLILADQGRKALHQVSDTVEELLTPQVGADKAKELAHLLSEGTWTHDFAITYEAAADMGLNVSDQMPAEILELMDLYPQPVRTRPSVTYLPSRRRASEEVESS